jgi:hypothetical protein
MSKSFVSQIPKNTLAPMYLGGGDGIEKKSGVYVPAHLRTKQSAYSSNLPSVTKKEVSLDQSQFPALPSKKEAKQSTPVVAKTMNYAEMAKKEGVVREVVQFKPPCPIRYDRQREKKNWGDIDPDMDFDEYDYEEDAEEYDE